MNKQSRTSCHIIWKELSLKGWIDEETLEWEADITDPYTFGVLRDSHFVWGLKGVCDPLEWNPEQKMLVLL